MKILILDLIDFDKNIKALENVKNVLAHRVGKPFQFEAIQLFEDLHEDQTVTDELVKAKIEQADKIILSGSKHAAFEDFHWKPRLAKALDIILALGKPTFAICFGAQIVAHQFGGKAIKNPKGTEFGSVKITLTEAGLKHPFLEGFHEMEKVHATHNDRIEVLPEEAVLLAYNDNSPVQAYQYKNIFATQFHPDLPTKNLHELLEMRKERYRENGFIKNDAHLEEIKRSLPEGEAAYIVLERFLDGDLN